MPDFIVLTSLQNTPLYIRRSTVLYVEGFTFAQEPNAGHIGYRITLLAGQWSDAYLAKEPVHVVIERLTA